MIVILTHVHIVLLLFIRAVRVVARQCWRHTSCRRRNHSVNSTTTTTLHTHNSPQTKPPSKSSRTRYQQPRAWLLSRTRGPSYRAAVRNGGLCWWTDKIHERLGQWSGRAGWVGPWGWERHDTTEVQPPRTGFLTAICMSHPSQVPVPLSCY